MRVWGIIIPNKLPGKIIMKLIVGSQGETCSQLLRKPSTIQMWTEMNRMLKKTVKKLQNM